MNQGKKRNLILELCVVVVSLAALLMLLYFVMAVSFQNGTTSSDITMKMAGQIARRIFEEPTQDQIATTALMIRYGAHLGLFFVVGFVTTFAGMAVFRGYYRIIGVIGAARSVTCLPIIRNIISSSWRADISSSPMRRSTGTGVWRGYSVWLGRIF